MSYTSEITTRKKSAHIQCWCSYFYYYCYYYYLCLVETVRCGTCEYWLYWYKETVSLTVYSMLFGSGFTWRTCHFIENCRNVGERKKDLSLFSGGPGNLCLEPQLISAERSFAPHHWQNNSVVKRTVRQRNFDVSWGTIHKPRANQKQKCCRTPLKKMCPQHCVWNALLPGHNFFWAISLFLVKTSILRAQ